MTGASGPQFISAIKVLKELNADINVFLTFIIVNAYCIVFILLRKKPLKDNFCLNIIDEFIRITKQIYKIYKNIS